MQNPNAAAQADPAVLTRFHQELARARGMGATAGPALWPRFAEYYQELARLPRKARRALQRRWRRSLGGIALLLALGQASALAAQIDVRDGCTLIDAITAANNNATAGGCSAGSGADVITLPAGSTQSLIAVNNNSYGANGLPVVTSSITIEGNGSTIARNSAATFRIFFVGPSGNLTLRNTTVSGGAVSNGHDGGAIRNQGTIAIINSTVSNNRASDDGAGIQNNPNGIVTLIDSTVSGNVAQDDGGGIKNDADGTVMITNSTVSDNTAASSDLPVAGGGGISNFGSLTLTASTITNNVASNANGGGVFNSLDGILTLSQTLVSGNSAFAEGPEVYNYSGEGSGTVFRNDFNLFGYDDSAGVTGFTPEATDIVPNVPLAAILNPTLGNNGGPTETHSLVTGSPAIDAVSAADCATANDQRGIARPQDGDDDTVADCDIGAFEVVEAPPQADLVLTTAHSPNPIFIGQQLTYTLTVGNKGPDGATAVTVTDSLPSSVSLVSATASQGSCSGTSLISCALGGLGNGANATVTIIVTPTSAGTLTNTASIAGNSIDPNPGNNATTTATTVQPVVPPIQQPQQPLPNAVPARENPRLTCNERRCRIAIKCDSPSGASCNVEVKVFVSARTLRLSDDQGERARRLLFAAGVSNIPTGQIANVRLKLRRVGRQIVRTSTRRRIRGVMEIRNSTGAASSTPVRIRLP